ncbi:HDIG domain-containing protein [Desulfocicer vacuolatum DSM 3385]|uniref:HDIG domain-containing protein n=1 Tax=Desulfocicer vacuolatum DSM 3385 TaxID=1121400 RepID=A0A1W2CAA5_9BACT|nr:HD domain-containing phosphohydrolase [Desulfocicer vacuolatum]SMC82195.1 HDIG domain-containing protein [Desulfocicer vacuolatum DSM 3385]
MLVRVKQYFINNFEQLFVLTILLSVTIINYYVPYKLAFLNFYFIPVLVASYFLGKNNTMFGALLCIFWVILIVFLSPTSFLFEQTQFSLFFNIVAWASFLLLAGGIIGKLQEQNKHLIQRHKEQSDALFSRLSTHLSVSADLSSELDFDSLFNLIVHKLSEAMKAERTSLYLIDEKNQEVWTRAAEQIEDIRLPLGNGICGKVAETGKIINVKDAWTLPYFNREFDLKHNFRTKAMICMPINNRAGKRMGIIQVINKVDGGFFCKEDEKFLKGLLSQVAIALENSFLMDELELSFESSIRTLSATVDARHPLTAGHSLRVTEYSLLVAEEMKLGKKDQEVIKYAAILHDIGKIAVKDSVLLKNGQFSDEERAEMNIHPAKTMAILEKFYFPENLQEVPFVAACHHEKINGEGYPQGLKGDQFPLGSKILAVADVFDALTSPRDYPKYDGNEILNFTAMPLARAMGILENERGSHFDSNVVDAFLRILPQALERHRGTHFSDEYIDDYYESIADMTTIEAQPTKARSNS